jgi:exopolysaccharide biosynthesis predicted pyruvyltransferase EpsI
MTKEGKIMVYMLDRTEEKEQFVNSMSKHLHLDTFIANSDVDNRKLPQEKRVQPPVEEWLRGFKDAEYVITDSFHACVFSIIFKKQFVVLGNKERGMSRFESLLKRFGLEDRLMQTDNIPTDIPDIDYSTVEPKVELLRQQSLDFLKNSLN